MKLGWIVIGGPAALRSEALERLELIADTYLSVGNAGAARAAEAARSGRIRPAADYGSRERKPGDFARTYR